ncbi:Cadherin-7 [Acipenser ruthenus]|uniref:Cadherin-7 n=1 Tax=Acipenser ruthenus TaxID=7906 RepID=A0A662YX51_ACIRT|nr:Cadherin-7 [Acipenser ruthenus]
MSPVGTSVVQVTATDADDPTYGNSARVVYSILQGQPYFSVEPKTESYQYNVPESLPVVSVVAKLKAADADVGPNAEMEYRIIDGDGLGMLRVSTDKETQEGVITLQKVKINQQDPSQVGRGIAVISVLDINDNAPMFAIEYETFLCENAQSGQVIQTISAVDKDEPPNGHRFYFALTPEAASNLNFTLRDNKDNTASILTKRNGFRRQDQSIYKLPIFIMDSGSPSLSSTNTLTIRVCDCDPDGTAQSCNAEAYVLPAGLSTGALIAILACVLTLLGMYPVDTL